MTQPTPRLVDWPRSYLRNRGRLTRGQRRALRELWPRYGVDLAHGQQVDVEQVFGRRAPVTLDIGFGLGDALIAYGRAFPERDVLGVEVHRPGLGQALTRIADAGLSNVRLVRHDVFMLLDAHCRSDTFSAVHVFFPEPWPKPTSHHRRLIRPAFLDLLADRCLPGAVLDVATDHPDYADAIRRTLTEHAAWGLHPEAIRPVWRPESKYERKGLAEGRPPHEIRATLRPVPTGSPSMG